MEENDQKELELLPSSHSVASASRVASDNSSLLRFRSTVSSSEGTPSLDLQLSISVRPMMRPGSDCVYKEERSSCVEALKWEAAEQIRVAAMEKAYAERVRELTRREMEMAQSEFARARQMWERAREEVERAERMKERATRQTDSTCMEITCQSCRQRGSWSSSMYGELNLFEELRVVF
ncbi:protein indeterminate-domain 14-like isoform X2 [Neltuma alba]|uniref:protein indeterminate-domain 14-like isoform X2 n=1 Tax=Neltuma alba TaxID=207710 RepID=UPI0010A47A29|nr:protein indeterminate-domain 14-like isoform X2 [Prosopis alba]